MNDFSLHAVTFVLTTSENTRKEKIIMFLFKMKMRDLSGGPVAKTP